MNPTWFWDAATKMVGQYAAIVPFFLLTDIVSNESSNFLEDELSWARMGQPMMEFLIAPMRFWMSYGAPDRCRPSRKSYSASLISIKAASRSHPWLRYDSRTDSAA
ncbi:hypothetical protein [Bradyrhizobium sp. USDA 4512]